MTLPPCALALGHSSLQDKVAAFLFAFLMEYGVAHMQDILDSFVSLTTDFGVEAGIAEFCSVAT
eukprot:1863108-Alexandrium_andersonii.AAC.1